MADVDLLTTGNPYFSNTCAGFNVGYIISMSYPSVFLTFSNEPDYIWIFIARIAENCLYIGFDDTA